MPHPVPHPERPHRRRNLHDYEATHEEIFELLSEINRKIDRISDDVRRT